MDYHGHDAGEQRGTSVYTVYAYDAPGRTSSITLPDGSKTQYVYQGNVTTMTDPSGHWKTNGNVTQFGGVPLRYDSVNRLTGANQDQYVYDSDNRRVYHRTQTGAETVYLYGAGGEKLETYTLGGVVNGALQVTATSVNEYFGGRLINAEGSNGSSNFVATDRVGWVVWSIGIRAPGGVPYEYHPGYYPYGVESGSTPNDTGKYATYTRDGPTGLDYAVNRYYASQWGGFCRRTRIWGLAAVQVIQVTREVGIATLTSRTTRSIIRIARVCTSTRSSALRIPPHAKQPIGAIGIPSFLPGLLPVRT